VTSGLRGKPDGKFDTELVEKGSTFNFTFKQAGSFPYFCSIHSGTEGVITVK
jgi:plastocyanin